MQVRNGVGVGQWQRVAAHASVSVAALLLANSAMAGGDGGFGGYYDSPNFPGPGHSTGDSATGTGGNGGQGLSAGAGGAGGTLGNDGAAGASSFHGGGGGGGGSGLIGNGPINFNVTGGAGGDGGNGSSLGGGGGGGGGAGFVVDNNNFATTIQAGTVISGGNGGSGGDAIAHFVVIGSGGGGGGGAGIFVTNQFGTLITVDSLAAVSGGNGGAQLTEAESGRGGAGEGGALGGDRNGNYAQGGAGIVGSNLILTISGTFSGGLSGDGVTRADAIRFTGGANELYFTNATPGLTGNINLDTASITLNQSADVTISNNFTGTGGVLIKDGANAVTLSGTNTFDQVAVYNGMIRAASSGALSNGAEYTVDGGTLDLNGHDLTMSRLQGSGGAIALGAADLTVNQMPNTSYHGDITGTGSLTKLGTGRLELAGSNTYSGGTTISAGTLRGDTTSIQGDIVNNAVLEFVGPGTFAGDISGTGNVAYVSNGTLNLTGANTYSGGTTISAGTLMGDTASIQGDIVNNATLQFGLAGSGTFAGDISGTGNVQVGSNGTLSLTGTNTYSGGTSLFSGELIVTTASLPGDIQFDPGTQLTFDQSTDGTYAGDITGFGTLTKSGTGTVILTGNSSTLSSINELAGGRLIVNGQLGGDVNVRTGATLGGSGTIGATVTVDAGGALAPGNSIGTLNVGGSLNFDPGSFYDVEVDPAGTASDKTVVTGTANLAGTVRHIGMTGTYRRDSTYRILEAGTIAGTFDAVTSNFAFLDPELLYGATYVDLQLLRNSIDFASYAGTANQRNVATALETVDQANDASAAVSALPDDRAQVQHALNQLSGEAHASGKGALVQGSQFLFAGIADRLRASSGGVGASAAPVMAFGGGSNLGGPRDDDAALAGRASLGGPSVRNEPELASATTRNFALWSQAFGAWGSSDSDGNAAALDRNIGGMLIGGDGRVGDWRVGAFTGYSRTDFSSSSVNTSGESDSYHLGAYAGRTWDRLALRTSVSHTWHDIETDRNVVFLGLSESLEAGYDADSTQAFAELGYTLASRGSLGLEAFANVGHVHLSSGSFTETGGAAALSSSGDDSDVTSTTLGLRAAYALRLGTLQAMARGSFGWRHAFGDLAPESRMAFSTGDSFAVAGTPLAEDSLALEAGLDAVMSATTTLGLTYNGEVSADTRDHGVKGDLRVRF